MMLDPGEYACAIHHPTAGRFPGTAEIEAGRDVAVHLYEWPFPDSGEFSQADEPKPRGNVLCELRLGVHLILIDAVARELLPEHLRITAPLAIAAPPGFVGRQSRYFGAELQITNCHRIFGTWPIHSLEWPRESAESGTERYAANWDADSKVEVSLGGNVDLAAEFYRSHSLNDRYRFELQSRPMFNLSASEPLSPSTWMTERLEPLRELVSLATLEQQRITIASVDRPEGEMRDRQVEYSLYSRHIDQAPYAPSADPIHDGQTLFTLRDVAGNAKEILSQWQRFRDEQPGVVEPLVAALTQPANVRSLFLGLVQSLEGIHAYRFGPGAVTPEEHSARRKAVLAEAKAEGVSAESVKWLHKWVDTRGQFRLHERLAQLASDVAGDVGSVPGSQLNPDLIAEIRNGLSHGGATYSRREFEPHVRSMAIVGVAQLLGIIGVPPTNISRFFR